MSIRHACVTKAEISCPRTASQQRPIVKFEEFMKETALWQGAIRRTTSNRQNG